MQAGTGVSSGAGVAGSNVVHIDSARECSAVDILRRLLEKAESGEVVEVGIVSIAASGNYATSYSNHRCTVMMLGAVGVLYDELMQEARAGG